MADFNGNGVFIARGIAIGDFRNRDTLDDLSLQPHHKVAAGGCTALLLVLVRQAVEIIPVVLCRASRIGHIVDHDIVNPLPAHIRP